MTTKRFGDDWDFQQRMQWEHALPLYRERFPGCEVVEVDTEGQHENVAQIFDWSGVDKMLRLESGATILLSQRFRRRSKGRDFSLTYSRPNANNPVEFERLQISRETDYAMMPQLYGFGVANDMKKWGFRRRVCIRTRIFRISFGKDSTNG